MIVFFISFPQMREVSLDYHDCGNDTKLSNFLHNYQQYQEDVKSQHKDTTIFCHSQRRKDHHSSPSSHRQSTFPTAHNKCCMSVVLAGLEPSKYNSCDVCAHQSSQSSQIPASQSCHLLSLTLPSEKLMTIDALPTECTLVMPSYSPTAYISMCCDNSVIIPSYPQSRLLHHTHHDSANRTPLERHTDAYIKHGALKHKVSQCERIRRQKLFGWIPKVQNSEQSFSYDIQRQVNISGLGCSTNRSLTFLTMDSGASHMFAERLGLDVHIKQDNSLLVLFDKQVCEVEYRASSRGCKQFPWYA